MSGGLVSAVVALLVICTLADAQQHPVQAGVYPDPKKTPGSLQELKFGVFCQSGWPSAHRNVSDAEKLQVYTDYGLPGGDYTGYCSSGCEVDHLIPLELGGSNNISNLWPQNYTGQWNAHTKDTLENKLHELVCCKAITADEATNAIATDWIAAYKTYLSKVC
ncbi:hypothetical protein O6H91_22G008000 [Diphasiastrum complanatum]|uniref:Uncharacterized protein n=1 Tax=Diphasiastrum complanatum TaxID=34168 RepID=A0ACC2ACR1_DIPCM|nr:hypothetical protein O6H91_22G008000 [Diphasiastrum complanatum]